MLLTVDSDPGILVKITLIHFLAHLPFSSFPPTLTSVTVILMICYSVCFSNF